MSRATGARALAVTAAAAVSAALLSGCAGVQSQVAGLAAVSGDRTVSVQSAAITVLQEKKVDVLVWPDCTGASKVTTCQGSTAAGEKITVESPATNPVTMVITVGDAEVFRGEVQPILNREAGKS